MFSSTASIQSKMAFYVQSYTHRVLTELKKNADTRYYTLLECHQQMSTTMSSYHEQNTLQGQIEAYDTYTYAFARSTAITDQIVEPINVYPSTKEFKETSHAYYMTLVYESAKKREHLNQMKTLDEQNINPNTNEPKPNEPSSTTSYDDATRRDQDNQRSDDDVSPDSDQDENENNQ